MSQAIADLKAQIENDPSEPELHLALGVELAVGGDSAAAAGAWEKALELDPEFAEAHYNLGVLYGRIFFEDIAVDELWEDHTDEEILFENAVSHLKDALSIDPELTPALNNLGHLYAVKGLVKEAKEYYQASLAIAGDQTDIQNDLEALN